MLENSFYLDATSLGTIVGASISAGSDDGTNDKTSHAFPGCGRHLSTREAVMNLQGAITGGSCGAVFPWVLSGHGAEGSIETGAGQNGPFERDNTIEYFFRDTWLPLIRPLASHPAKILRLSSCDTGAGEEGADLLYLIAKEIGKVVEARTGLTLINEQSGPRGTSYFITYEEGSQWQTATPNTRPSPIQKPQHFSTQRNFLSEKVILDDLTAINFKEIEYINLYN